MNYKQSNWLIDTVMPEVPANAFKVIALVARKTWGWGKDRESISLSDFRQAIGVSSKQTTSRAVDDALESGYLARAETGNTFEYWPVMNGTQSVPENGTEIGEVDGVDERERYRNRGTVGTEIGAENGTQSVPKQSSSKEVERKTKETTGTDPALGQVFDIYLNNFGGLTKLIEDDIKDAYDDYGAQWLIDAMRESVRNNVRKWNYTEAILERWATEGRGKARASPPANGTQQPVYEADPVTGAF